MNGLNKLNILATELQNEGYHKFLAAREVWDLASKRSCEQQHYKVDVERSTKLIPNIKIPIFKVKFKETGSALLSKFLWDTSLLLPDADPSIIRSNGWATIGIKRLLDQYGLDPVVPKKIKIPIVVPLQFDETDILRDIAIGLSKAEVNITEKLNSSKTLSYTLTVCFAEQFERLRNDLGIDRKEFIDSLKYCTKWASTGGKTESDFFKTNDKRFIGKSILNNEYEMSMQLAPDYFRYFQSLKISETRTLLCPIVGIYELKVGTEPTKYLIIMNNLFYGLEDRGISLKVYDLKGSRKNRLRKENLKGKTLMDTNFDLERNGDLLPLVDHPKLDFFDVIERDCNFLRQQEIVDYSLLLILDEENRVVVCGIIDYLRKYDLIKKLEHQIKKLQYLGEDPTIVKPEVYANRFIESLRRRIMITQNLNKKADN